MDRFDRIYEIHKRLQRARQPVSHVELEQMLECARATVNRVIRDMRLYFNAPIVYDHERNGYRYEPTADGGRFELPGLWFNADETFALLACQQLLSSLQPGLLGQEIEPFRQRIEKLLSTRHTGGGQLAPRMRILGISRRMPAAALFGPLGNALTRRCQLELDYDARGSGQRSLRVISPQRLVRYRDNWYLDAWDHLREDLRVFAVDRIRDLVLRDTPAIDIPDERLDAVMTAGYGIFSGAVKDTAVLRFSATRARWVADEEWHPAQESRWLADGAFELRVPYSDERELVMDIMKHGPDCEVLAPPALRVAVAALLEAAAGQYRAGHGAS